jgi:hypothetical protein
MKVLKSAPGPEQNFIEGTLKEVLYHGPITQIYVSPKEGSSTTMIVTQPNTAISARKSFNMGDRVFVAWSPEDCILMGRDSALPAVDPVPQIESQAAKSGEGFVLSSTVPKPGISFG